MLIRSSSIEFASLVEIFLLCFFLVCSFGLYSLLPASINRHQTGSPNSPATPHSSEAIPAPPTRQTRVGNGVVAWDLYIPTLRIGKSRQTAEGRCWLLSPSSLNDGYKSMDRDMVFVCFVHFFVFLAFDIPALEISTLSSFLFLYALSSLLGLLLNSF